MPNETNNFKNEIELCIEQLRKNTKSIITGDGPILSQEEVDKNQEAIFNALILPILISSTNWNLKREFMVGFVDSFHNILKIRNVVNDVLPKVTDLILGIFSPGVL